MANGPSDEDIKRAEREAEKQKQMNAALGGFVQGNRLDPMRLKLVLDTHAPGNDAPEDGVYDQPWLGTDTFYRFTEEYVPLENRLAFKMELERTWPGKKS